MTDETQSLPTQAFVLLSGGIDSTTCLYLARKEFGPENTFAFSIHYGQRHEKELYCAQAICERHAGVQHRIVRLGDQAPSMLTDPDRKIPSISYDEIKGVSPTYVPFRNGQLLSRIAGLAHAQLKKDQLGVIYFGAHAEDAQGWAYPDCTPEFIGAMANAIYIGTYMQVRLATPLEWLTKRQIIEVGLQLAVPYEMTWSCYAGGEMHCGTCPTCRARHQGFSDAGYIDPTEYADTSAFKEEL